ncbi:hypothetical protein [Okeania sp. KiyG1]|uniref:hypothetical protein n=1 Tax=Okeania sp. KiyG1 TaxID=2720165 RepID=UPI001924C3D0|nr:hypothetical protein [Okeania sp. KiyG1]
MCHLWNKKKEEGRRKKKEEGRRKKEEGRTGLTQINLENAICRGEWHSPSLDLVSVRKSSRS